MFVLCRASDAGADISDLTGMSAILDASAQSFTIRLSGTGLNAQSSPGQLQWCGAGQQQGVGKTFGKASGYWTLTVFKSDVFFICPIDYSLLKVFGKAKITKVKLDSVSSFTSIIPAINSQPFAWIIDGKININQAGNYDWCLWADDGSYLYLNGNLVLSLVGAFKGQWRCNSVVMKSGMVTVQVRGVDGGGGASQHFTYSGPDTGNQKVYPRSSVTTGAAKLTPLNGFTMCLFNTDFGLGSMPNTWEADTQGSHMVFKAAVQISTINLPTIEQFDAAVPATVSHDNVFWTIFGVVKIATPGNYVFCISSDDG